MNVSKSCCLEYMMIMTLLSMKVILLIKLVVFLFILMISQIFFNMKFIQKSDSTVIYCSININSLLLSNDIHRNHSSMKSKWILKWFLLCWFYFYIIWSHMKTLQILLILSLTIYSLIVVLFNITVTNSWMKMILILKLVNLLRIRV